MVLRLTSMLILLMAANTAAGACVDKNNPPEKIGDFQRALICLEQSIIKLERAQAGGSSQISVKQTGFENPFMTVTPRSISPGSSDSVLASLIIQNKLNENLLLAAQTGTAHLGDKRGLTVQRTSINGLLEISKNPAYTKQKKYYTIISPNAMQPVKLVFHSPDLQGDQFDLTITFWRMVDRKGERHDVSLIGVPVDE